MELKEKRIVKATGDRDVRREVDEAIEKYRKMIKNEGRKDIEDIPPKRVEEFTDRIQQLKRHRRSIDDTP